MRPILALLGSFLAISGIGCDVDTLEGPPIEPDVRAHIQSYLDGDTTAFISFYSPDFVDLGGGDGIPFDIVAFEQQATTFFDSEEFKADFAGIEKPEDALDMAEMQIRTYEEFIADEDLLGIPELFQPNEDDLQVAIAPLPGSPLFDGWYGYYRTGTDRWLKVAGD